MNAYWHKITFHHNEEAAMMSYIIPNENFFYRSAKKYNIVNEHQF